jgi:hypothetical protein
MRFGRRDGNRRRRLPCAPQHWNCRSRRRLRMSRPVQRHEGLKKQADSRRKQANGRLTTTRSRIPLRLFPSCRMITFGVGESRAYRSILGARRWRRIIIVRGTRPAADLNGPATGHLFRLHDDSSRNRRQQPEGPTARQRTRLDGCAERCGRGRWPCHLARLVWDGFQGCSRTGRCEPSITPRIFDAVGGPALRAGISTAAPCLARCLLLLSPEFLDQYALARVITAVFRSDNSAKFHYDQTSRQPDLTSDRLAFSEKSHGTSQRFSF